MAGQRLDALFIELSLRTGNVATEISRIQRELAKTAESAAGVATPLGSFGTSLSDIERRSAGASQGIRRIGDQALKVATDVVGLKGPVEGLATSFLQFGAGGAVVGAVVAGLTLLKAKFDETAEAQRKADAEANELAKRLIEDAENQQDPTAPARRQLELARDNAKAATKALQEALLDPVRVNPDAVERRSAAASPTLGRFTPEETAERRKQAELRVAAVEAAEKALATAEKDAVEKRQREAESASDKRLAQLQNAQQQEAALRQEFLSRTAAATQSVVDDAQRKLDEFLQKIGTARERIARERPGELAAFDAGVRGVAGQLEAAVEDAKLTDGLTGLQRDAEDLAKQISAEPFRDVTEEIGKQIANVDALIQRFDAYGIAADDERRVKLNALLAQLYAQQAKSVSDQAIARGDEARVRSDQIDQEVVHYGDTQKFLAEQPKKYREIAAAQAEVEQGSKSAAERSAEALENSLRLARSIETVARGAIQLADAFGLVDDALAASLQNLTQIATNVPVLVNAIRAGSTGDIISSSVGILGGLAGLVTGNPERDRITKENTEALRELTRRVGDLGGPLGQLPGSTTAGVQQALDAVLAKLPPLFKSASRDADLLRGELDRLGLRFEDLQEVARAAGVEFIDAARPTREELEKLAAALRAVELTQFAESLSGQLDALQARFELFDIDDPLAQLEALAAVIANLGKAGSPLLASTVAGADLTTAGGRAALEAALQDIFARAAAGEPIDLGGLSPQEFFALLQRLEGLIDQANGQAGTSQSFGIDRTITEVTGSRIAAVLSTQVLLLRELNETALRQLAVWDPSVNGSAAALRAPLEPPTPSPVSRGGSTIVIEAGAVGSVVVTLQLSESEITPEQLAERLTTRAVDVIAEKLAQRIEQRRRASGDARTFR